LIKEKKHILIINKNDLKKNLKIPNYIDKSIIVEISAEKGEIKKLEDKVESLFSSKIINDSSLYPLLSEN